MAEKKLTVEEFTIKAIKNLKKTPYKGIHTVYSGFNQAFREYFLGKNPIEEVNALVKQGKIALRFAKGGAMIYLPGEEPQAKSVLGDILK